MTDTSSDIELTLRLPVDVRSPAIARRVLDGVGGIDPSVHEDVQLLVSELVANSVRHAGLGGQDVVEVRVRLSGEVLRAEVIDHGQTFALDPARLLDATQGRGLGLFLVDGLSNRWGYSSDGTNLVWFEIELAARSGLAIASRQEASLQAGAQASIPAETTA